jgi:hypothetical protein
VFQGPTVTKTAVQALPAGSSEDDLPTVIAAMPISVRERRIAFGLIIVLAIIDLITVTFGNAQLARVDSFIPVIQTVMSVVDLVTAAFCLRSMRSTLRVQCSLWRVDIYSAGFSRSYSRLLFQEHIRRPL